MLGRLGSATVFGYGSAIGRDGWRATKKNAGAMAALAIVLLVLAGALVAPFWGGRELTRGHDRSISATVFLTLAFPVFLFGLGVAFGHVADIWLQQYQGVYSEGAAPRLSVILAICGGSFALGALFGLAERSGRKEAFSVNRDNTTFMMQRGFMDEGEDRLRDSRGKLLRLLDRTPGQLTLLAVGRRNRRAYIGIAPDGRFTAYSGVVSAGEIWDGTDAGEPRGHADETVSSTGQDKSRAVDDTEEDFVPPPDPVDQYGARSNEMRPSRSIAQSLGRASVRLMLKGLSKGS